MALCVVTDARNTSYNCRSLMDVEAGDADLYSTSVIGVNCHASRRNTGDADWIRLCNCRWNGGGVHKRPRWNTHDIGDRKNDKQQEV